MLRSPQFLPHPRPNSTCLYSYTTGKKNSLSLSLSVCVCERTLNLKVKVEVLKLDHMDKKSVFLFEETSVKHPLISQLSHVLSYLFINQPAFPSFRCLIEAWSLLRQHSNRLNMGELLGFLYESCQELGLIKELLKLPLGLSEQVGEG